MKPICLYQRWLTYLVCWLISVQPVLANVRPDIQKPGNTQINRAGNGVEIVNITTPNRQGLSHNYYTEFNVDPSGLILNNATKQFSQSQLGGFIQNNPNLKNTHAKVILNEVTTANISSLRGYTEVLGQQAEVILANPYGISCSGCGFINTPRVTLTTGKPELDQSGMLKDFRVNSGQIEITGDGLDASRQDYFDIITQTAKINAEIHANNLAIITGNNSVEYKSNQILATEQTPTGAGLAIDSSSLGGMYAGRIQLVATAQGVGVNLAGDLAATISDITLDAEGKVVINKTYAANNIQINTPGAIQASVSQYAGNKLTLNSADKVALQQSYTAAGQQILIAGTNLETSDSKLIAGIDDQGKSVHQGRIEIRTQSLDSKASLIKASKLSSQIVSLKLDNQSTLDAAHLENQQWRNIENDGLVIVDKIAIDSDQLNIKGQGQFIADEISIHTKQLQLDASFAAKQKLTLTVDDRLEQSNLSSLISDGDISLAAKNIQLDGVSQSLGQLSLAAKQGVHIGQDASIASAAQLSVNANSLTNEGSLSAASTVIVTGKLSNPGHILAQDQLQVTAEEMSSGGKLHAGKNLYLTATTLNNTGDILSSVDSQLVIQKDLTNRGQLLAGQSLQLKADKLTNEKLISASNLAVFATELTNLSKGEIAGQNLLFNVSEQLNNQANILAEKSIVLTSDHIISSGLLHSGKRLSLQGKQIENSGKVLSGKSGELVFSDTLINSGQIVTADSLILNTGRLDNLGEIKATDLSLTLESLENQHGSRLLGDTLTLNTTSLNNAGDIQTQQSLAITSNSAVNSGVLQSGNHFRLNGNTLLNSGSLLSGQNISLGLSQWINNQGEIKASESSVLEFYSFENTGQLLANQLTLQGEQVTNQTSGQILSQASIEAEVTTINNLGTLHAGDRASLKGHNLINRGQLLSAQQLELTFDEVEQSGEIQSGDKLDITSQQLSNQGKLFSLASVRLNIALDMTNTGEVKAGDRLQLNTARLTNKGRISAASVDGVMDNADLTDTSEILAQTAVNLTIATANNQGTIQAGTQLNLKGNQLTSNGALLAVESLTINTNQNIKGGGQFQAGDTLTLTTSELATSGLLSGDALNVIADTARFTGPSRLYGERLWLTLATELDNQGEFYAGSSLDITAPLANNTGLLHAGSALFLSADDLTNSGRLLSAENLQLDIAADLDNSGLIGAEQNLKLTSASIRHQGILLANEISLDTKRLITSPDSEIKGINVGLSGLSELNNNGNIQAQKQLNITATNLFSSGTLHSGELSTLASDTIQNTGQLIAIGSLALTSNQLINHGDIYIEGNLDLSANRAIFNAGSLVSRQNIALETAFLTNNGLISTNGSFTTSANQVELGAQGQLQAFELSLLNLDRLNNQGEIQIQGQARLTGKQLQLDGQGLLVADRLMITADQATIAGDYAADKTLQVSVVSGLKVLGNLMSDTQMTLEAGWVDFYGSAQAKQNIKLAANGNIRTYSQAQVVSDSNLLVTSNELNNAGILAGSQLTLNTQDLSNPGKLLAEHQLDLNSKNMVNSGVAQAGSALNVSASSVANTGKLLSGGSAEFNLTTNLTNQGTLASSGPLHLKTESFINQSLTSSGSDIILNTPKGLTNGNGAQLLAGGDIIATDLNAIWLQGLLQAEGDIRLSAKSSIEQRAQLVSLGEQILSSTQSLTLSGQHSVGDKLTLTGEAGLTLSSVADLAALGDIELNGPISSLQGEIVSNGNLSINSVQDLTNSADISVLKSLQLSSTGSLTNLGNIYADQLTLTAARQLNLSAGSVLAGKQLNMTGQGITLNTDVVSLGSMRLDVLSGKLVNNHNLISLAGLNLNANGVENHNRIHSGGTLDLNSTGGFSNTGQLISARDLTLTASNIDNLSTIQSGGHSQITASQGALYNPGTIASAGDLSITATSDITNQGLIYANGSAGLYSNASIQNLEADILSVGNLTLAGQSGMANQLLNRSGVIESLNGDLQIFASSLSNIRTLFEVTETEHDYSNSLPGGGGSFTVSANHSDAPYINEGWEGPPLGGGGQSTCGCGSGYTVYYALSEQLSYKLTDKTVTLGNISSPSRILAGGNINLQANSIHNEASQIGANANLHASGSLINQSYQEGEVETWIDYRSDPYSGKSEPSSFTFRVVGTREESRLGNVYNSSITAGGAITGSFNQLIDNTTIKAHSGPVSLSNQQGFTASIPQPNVTTPDDLLSVDMLSYQGEAITNLPGSGNGVANPDYRLPGNPNGLFVYSEKVDSPYLIETNPAIPGLGNLDPSATLLNLNLGAMSNLTSLDLSLANGLGGLTIIQPDNPSFTALSGTEALNINQLPPGTIDLPGSQGPGNHYQVENSAELTNLGQFLGSDFLFELIGYRPSRDIKVLGDAFYDTRIISQAIFEQTGQRYLAREVSSDLIQMQYLLDNAAHESRELALTMGVSLSTDQVAALSKDMVWWEKTLINGKEVLAPKLYLANLDERSFNGGSLISGQDVLLQGGTLTNQGSIIADNRLQLLDMDSVLNDMGTIKASGDLAIVTQGDITNISGQIKGNNITLVSLGGHIKNQTRIDQLSVDSGSKVYSDLELAEIQAKIDTGAPGITLPALVHTRTEIGPDAVIAAGGELNIVSAGELLNLAGDISALKDLNIDSDSVSLTAGILKEQQTYQGSNYNSFKLKIDSKQSKLSSGGNLNIHSRGDINIDGSHISAEEKANLHANGNVTLIAATNQTSSDYETRNGALKQTTDTVSHQASEITAGEDVNITAEQDITLAGSKIVAGDTVHLDAGGALSLVTVQDFSYSLDKKESSSLLGKDSLETEQSQTTVVSSEIHGSDILLTSKADITLQAASLSAGNITISSTAGAVNLLSAKETASFRQESSESGLFVKMKGQGKSSETRKLTQIEHSGSLSISSALGLNVDYVQQQGQSLAQALDSIPATKENLAWIKTLNDRDDINWQAVSETFDSWEYEQESLSPAVAAIIAVVVTVVSAGTASAAGAAITEAAVTAGVGTSVGAVAGAAVTAGSSALFSQAAITLANNKGEIGATLNDLASKNTVKALAIAMLTAGAISGFDTIAGLAADKLNLSALGADNPVISLPSGEAITLGDIGQKVAHSAIKSGIGAGFGNGDFQDLFLSSLRSTAANEVGAIAAYQIGGLAQDYGLNNGDISKAALHAITGGAVAELGGGDFVAGAAAGAATELTSNLIDDLFTLNEDKIKAAQIIGAAAGAIASGDAEGVYTGQNTASNIITFNHLSHQQLVNAAQALKDCGDNANCRDHVAREYTTLSQEQEHAALTACAADTSYCKQAGNEVANSYKAGDEAYWLLENEDAIKVWQGLDNTNKGVTESYNQAYAEKYFTELFIAQGADLDTAKKLAVSSGIIAGLGGVKKPSQNTQGTSEQSSRFDSTTDKPQKHKKTSEAYKGKKPAIVPINSGNAVNLAKSWQTQFPYVGQDPMTPIALPEGKILAQVVFDADAGPAGSYFTTPSAIRRATLPDGSIDANILSQGLQIDGSKYPSFRANVQYFQVNGAIPYGEAAFGRTIANQHLNPDGYKALPQVFLKEDFFKNMKPVDMFGNPGLKAYPMINTETPSYFFEWLPKK